MEGSAQGESCFNKQTRRIILLLFVFLVLYLIVGSLNYSLPDFQNFNKAAERIAHGELLYGDHIKYLNVYHYPPFFLYSLGAIFWVFNSSPFTAKAFLAVFNVLTGTLIYLLARERLNEKYSMICLLIFLLNPFTFTAVYAGYFDNFVVFFILLTMYFLNRYKPLLGGAALSAGFMSKLFPIILIPVLIARYLKNKYFLGRFLLSFMVITTLIASPFLLHAFNDFLHYAFLYNFERTSASMSIYYYFLPGLGDTVIPVILQLALLGWVSYNVRFHPRSHMILYFILFLGFMTLNRINYPHYILYAIPFFSYILAEELQTSRKVFGSLAWKHLLIPFIIMHVGIIIWTYPWYIGVFDFKSSPFFWWGASIYYVGTLYLLAVLFRLYFLVTWSTRED
ncbi:MAG: glycosyltransferase family 39 protein [Archaeoglobaceae archaeon]